MILYPAIDLRGGKVVRLVEGDPRNQTIYSDDPLEVARRWQDAGAEWLHVINLDGALEEAATNRVMLKKIADLGLPVQFGGGLRSLEDAAQALDSGAQRVILGTLLVENPSLAGSAVQRFGAERIVAALDSRDGIVAVRGWQDSSDRSAVDLGKRFAGEGIQVALYTDIARDGALGGVNIEATQQLAQQTGLSVMASGGVASLSDVVGLRASGIEGVVIGQALYQGLFTLREALAAAHGAAQKEG